MTGDLPGTPDVSSGAESIPKATARILPRFHSESARLPRVDRTISADYQEVRCKRIYHALLPGHGIPVFLQLSTSNS
jgi:hypothetical protein